MAQQTKNKLVLADKKKARKLNKHFKEMARDSKEIREDISEWINWILNQKEKIKGKVSVVFTDINEIFKNCDSRPATEFMEATKELQKIAFEDKKEHMLKSTKLYVKLLDTRKIKNHIRMLE